MRVVLCCVALAMAVCIVDVDSEHTPTIQYGNMYVLSVILSSSYTKLHTLVIDGRPLAACRYRIDPNKYDRELEE